MPYLSNWLSKRRAIVLLLAALVGLLGCYTGLAVYKADEYTTTPRQAFGDRTPADLGMPFEAVSFKPSVDDGVDLHGWWIKQQGNGRAVVLVHGRYQNRLSMLGLAQRLWERGYSVLLFDLRGHGLSSTAACSYGLRERYDVLGAVAFVESREFGWASIGVLGWSLGAASALMAMDQQPGLAAVVSDSAYADGSPLLARNLLRPGLKLALRVMKGADIDAVRPAQAVARAREGRVFLIHGAGDSQVPVEHLRRIQRSGGEQVAETWIVSGAGHIGAFALIPDEYVDRIDVFFTANLVSGATG